MALLRTSRQIPDCTLTTPRKFLPNSFQYVIQKVSYHDATKSDTNTHIHTESRSKPRDKTIRYSPQSPCAGLQQKKRPNHPIKTYQTPNCPCNQVYYFSFRCLILSPNLSALRYLLVGSQLSTLLASGVISTPLLSHITMPRNTNRRPAVFVDQPTDNGRATNHDANKMSILF